MNDFNVDEIFAAIDLHFSEITDEELDAKLELAGINDYCAEDDEVFLRFTVTGSDFFNKMPLRFEKISISDQHPSWYKLAA